MLCLAGVLLSCASLCLASPVPPPACAARSLILETLHDIEKLRSEGSSETMPPSNMVEVRGNTTYLEGFMEALKSRKNSLEARQIVQKLQKIWDVTKSCLRWMEQDWEPVEEEDFFSNLEDLLRFLNHNAPLEKTA